MPGTAEWFKRIEDYRYEVEPVIHSVAQFTRHRGQRLLEVGVGAGTDHVQWARAGAECYGVDLTDAAILTTRWHLELYGLSSHLQRMDAEELQFADNFFDIVYSWGVIHHADNPQRVISEIHRVLKPGGLLIGMMYGRHSVAAFKFWLKHGPLKGRPWRSFSDIIWEHVESIGTKAYSVRELRRMLSAFSACDVRPVITIYDTARWPQWLSQFLPDRWGWFMTFRARR